MSSKTLTHEQAAKRDQYCPMCRLISHDTKPGLYQCVKCEEEGYDCCVAGNGVICVNCEDSEFHQEQPQ